MNWKIVATKSGELLLFERSIRRTRSQRHRAAANGTEAAEILNSLRMDRYREQCEKLKHSELQGTPAVYPRQIPFLESR